MRELQLTSAFFNDHVIKILLFNQKGELISVPVWLENSITSQQVINPFFSSTKVMRGERLGNFLHCVVEHLPLHWKKWKREGAIIRFQNLWSIRTSTYTSRIIFMFSLEDCLLVVPQISFDHGTLILSFSLLRTEFFSRLFSIFSFSIAHRVTRRSWESKRDGSRYSIVVMFATSSNNEDEWVLLSKIATRLL